MNRYPNEPKDRRNVRGINVHLSSVTLKDNDVKKGPLLILLALWLPSVLMFTTNEEKDRMALRLRSKCNLNFFDLKRQCYYHMKHSRADETNVSHLLQTSYIFALTTEKERDARYEISAYLTSFHFKNNNIIS